MSRNQRGMTLIEVILVVSITAILAGAGATTYFQVMKGSGMSNNRAEALSDIERAADWFTVDALQAQFWPAEDWPPPTDPDLSFIHQANLPPELAQLNEPITFIWIDELVEDKPIKLISYEHVNSLFMRKEYIINIDDYYEDITDPHNLDELESFLKSFEDYEGHLVSTATVARNISTISCNFDETEQIIILTLTATVGRGDFDRVSETRSYEIISRSNLE